MIKAKLKMFLDLLGSLTLKTLFTFYSWMQLFENVVCVQNINIVVSEYLPHYSIPFQLIQLKLLPCFS